MTEGRTSQAEAESYLEVRKRLKADEGQSAEDPEVPGRTPPAVEECRVATRRCGPRGRPAQVRASRAPPSGAKVVRGGGSSPGAGSGRGPCGTAGRGEAPGPRMGGGGRGEMADLVHGSKARRHPSVALFLTENVGETFAVTDLDRGPVGAC